MSVSGPGGLPPQPNAAPQMSQVITVPQGGKIVEGYISLAVVRLKVVMVRLTIEDSAFVAHSL